MVPFITQCSQNDSDPDQFILDTNAGVGGGVVFLNEDYSLHVRIRVEERAGLYQIDNILNEYLIDTLVELRLNGDNAHFSRIIGMDVLVNLNVTREENSLFEYKINTDTTIFAGMINVAGYDESKEEDITVAGKFELQIGEIGQSSWGCDSEDRISNCSFLD